MTNGWNSRVVDEKTRRLTASGGKWNSNRTGRKPAQSAAHTRFRRLAAFLVGYCARMWISRDHTKPKRMKISGSSVGLVGGTEGFRRCRLVVERIQQRLDDVVAWFANALSPMLAVVVACRGDQF